MNKSWKDIFENFNSSKMPSKFTTRNLLIMAGHLKSKTAEFNLSSWNKEMKKIKDKICVKNGKILEIGSGTGALLKTFEDEMNIYGVDYSSTMVAITTKAIPKGKFQYCEAKNINFPNNYFDSIIIYSSAQYFPDLEYFKKVLNKINKFLKKNGKLYLGELVEKNKQKDFNEFRRKQLSFEEYKKKYLGKQNQQLKHFAIDRDQIYVLLKKNFKNIEILNSIKRGKEKEIYRFDVCCQKK
jgi:ubiquinone/menaquinone biosynthesis C-methylase UbiE